MTTREDIAGALSEVDGLKGSPFRPAVYKSGQAWPQLVGYDRQNAGFFEATWQIWVVLPADEKSAQLWIESNTAAVLDALQAVVYVDRVDLAQIQLSTGTNNLNALMITARSE